jgi:hypothetical protein
VSCIDFAPTIAAMLGMTLRDVDGATIREVLPPGQFATPTV